MVNNHHGLPPSVTTTSAVVVRAEQLFQGGRTVCIEHAGQRYHLRITRENKLILTK